MEQDSRIPSPVYWLLWAAPLAAAAAVAGVGVVISLAIVILVILFNRSARRATLKLRFHSIPLSLAIGVIAGVAMQYAMSGFIEPALERTFGAEIDLSSFENVEGNLQNYLILLALGLLFGGVAEELVFRGYVIGWGATLFGSGASFPLALFSAAVFGASHLYQGMAGVVSTGFVGFCIGVTYILARRALLPVIAMHMTINFIGITEIYRGAPLLPGLQ